MKIQHSRLSICSLMSALFLTLTATVPTSAGGFPSVDGSGAWQLSATAYMWLQGISGHVSALGHESDFNAGASDLMKYADYSAQGIAVLRFRRWLLLADASWTPLTVDKSSSTLLPLPPGMAFQVEYRPLIATSEVGYRLLSGPGYDLDGLAGVRYWHFRATLSLNPSPAGRSLSSTTKWADPVVGIRLRRTILPRLEATVWGDIGGAGAGSHLDYQVVSGLGYRLTPGWFFDGAWRRLYADYRGDRLQSRTTESGMVFGLTRRIF